MRNIGPFTPGELLRIAATGFVLGIIGGLAIIGLLWLEIATRTAT